jgi:hypothetical protein
MIWAEGYREGVRKREDEIERLREMLEDERLQQIWDSERDD